MMQLKNLNTAPLSFSDADVLQVLKNQLFHYFDEQKLNPFITEDWRRGIFQLFGVKPINIPNLDKANYVLAANHISDFDAIILGLLHPKIRIVAKIGWANNNELMSFLKLHYDIVGVYRNSEINILSDDDRKLAKAHNFKLFREINSYLKDTSEARHLLLFPQGTISDINNNSSERVNPGFTKIARAANVGIVNIFTEYPWVGGATRIIGGAPYTVAERSLSIDYSDVWLKDVISLQSQLEDTRSPLLSQKHLQNNSSGEPYF